MTSQEGRQLVVGSIGASFVMLALYTYAPHEYRLAFAFLVYVVAVVWYMWRRT